MSGTVWGRVRRVPRARSWRWGRRAPLAWAAALALASGCARTAASDTSAPAAPPPADVRTAAVAEVEAPLVIRLSGTLRGEREADLAANATGRVAATFFERGMRVKAGRVLVQLDVRTASMSAAEARAQAESARAQAAQLKSECERYERMRATGTVTDMAYDRAASSCHTSALSAEASVARAEMAAQTLRDGTIRAPFDGVVIERAVEVGEFVKPDSRVATLVSTDTLRLVFPIPEREAAAIHEGGDVTFRVAASDRPYHGTIKFVSGSIREDTRDLPVEAIVDNAGGSLRPGMFADIELTVGSRKLAGVPKEAIMERDRSKRAFFVVDGRLEERILSTLPEVAGAVPVVKGAKTGEQVALGDLTLLRNGQRVR